MVRYALVDNEINVYYIARKHTSGLSDVSVVITNLSDGSSELTSTSMTEISSTGVYKYIHTFTEENEFLVKCNSISIPKLSEEVYETYI